ncbi:MAG: LytTR family DNA-binding domain-containing protein [Flammeovirgaceae bacterium]|nr:LytTR family DNA-binding domain-containing protein [Flammeovirgaceae bacterium]MDW8287049.1 LytTR family DNA-binding domain-containing protein [Flammeovirgaceae bacterium]
MLACLIAVSSKIHREQLHALLEEFLEEDLQIVGMATSLEDAYQQIEQLHPNLVFLEASFLASPFPEQWVQITKYPLKIVWIHTSSEGLQAFLQENTMGCLFLPALPQQIESLLGELLFPQYAKKTSVATTAILRRIGISDSEGIHVIDLDKIIRFEADGNYTKIFLSDGSRLVTAKTLKEYDTYLSNHHFFRVHQSHLINLRFVKRYLRGSGGTIIMWDGSQLEVARRKKQQLLEKITGLF